MTLRTFYDLDRRCRSEAPRIIDLADRSSALLALGLYDRAARDLARVERDNLQGPAVLRWLMLHHHDAGKRFEAASALLGLDGAGDAEIEAALKIVFGAGETLVLRATRQGSTVSGWVAWLDDGAPEIELRVADGSVLRAPSPVGAGLPGRHVVRRARFAVPVDPTQSVEVTAHLGAGPSRAVVVYPCRGPLAELERPPVGDPRLTVVLPVFGDPDSLAQCLDALRGEAAEGVAFVVIDDASADGRVTALARRFCGEVRGTYLRSRINAGFASSVNRGIARSLRGDVLILNSDVILSPGALARLRSAAHAAPDIGTVSPLSNDAGEASFPDPLGAAPALSAEERDRVDAAARRANAGVVVDLLAALGSCLYVTRGCLDRIGLLSLRYGRGYYEDVDLCLRAVEAGFRNVAACDVYVTHLGGRSFGAERRALVTRNHDIARQRFPEYERADAVFDAADPLRGYRSRIEELIGPPFDAETLIVGPAVGSEALIAHRARVREGQGGAVLVLTHARTASGFEVAVTACRASWPRALHFPFEGQGDGADRLVAYLGRMRLAEVEVLQPESLPDPLRRALARTGIPVSYAVESLRSARAVASLSDAGVEVEQDARAGGSRRPASRGREGDRSPLRLALDRMSAAHLGLHFPARPTRPNEGRSGPDGGRRMLGIVACRSSPAAEALLLALARAMRRRSSTHLLVLGAAVDEAQLMASGNVWVMGPLGHDDPADVARPYGVDALFSPHRASSFWCLDALRRDLGVPCAYFDWSEGAVEAEPGDLALDWRAPEHEVCARVAAWCAPAAA